MATKAEMVWLRISAMASLIYFVLMIIGTSEYLRRAMLAMEPSSERDVWAGGDVVQAIRQRAQTASLYYSGFQFSIIIMTIGAGIQCALAYRQTRDAPTALRSFFQVELVYQVIRSHLNVSKSSDSDKDSSIRAAHVARMSNCGVYFYWGFMGCMVTFLSVLQKPLRASVHGKDMITIWSMSGVAAAIYIGVIVAHHIGSAQWSVWHTRPKKPAKAHQGNGNGVIRSPVHSRTPTMSTEPEVQVPGPATDLCGVGTGVLRAFTCVISVLAHLATYLLLSLLIRGRLLAVLVGHWVVSSVAYFAVSREAVNSMFWGFLSFMMHIGFNRTTHRKPWWVGLLTSVVFSSVGIACGALQSIFYIFTYRYSTAEYTGGTNTVGHVSLERSVGISTACFAAADLVVHLAVLVLHMHSGVSDYEAEVQMPSIT